MKDMSDGKMPTVESQAKLLDNDSCQAKLLDDDSLEIPNPPTTTYLRKSILEDIKSLMFCKALFAEFLGTCLLVLVAVGSTLQISDLDIVQIALSFGLAVATSVWIIGHVSGGHINPAVTIAMLVTRRISLIRGLLYIIMQCAGSAVGAGLLRCLTPSVRQGGLGTTTLNEGVSPAMGVGIEFCITTLLVLTVFATCDNSRTDHSGSFPLAIGLSVSVGHLWAVEFCGSSMNPARSLGPAIVMNVWRDHWVYWVGPMTGGVFAGLLYENLLASNASLGKAKKFFLMSKVDEEACPLTNDTTKTTIIRKVLNGDVIQKEPEILVSPVA